MHTTLKHTASIENQSLDLDRRSAEPKRAFASQQSKFNTTPFDFNQIPLQAKLKINTPGDRYEQEADRIADRVVNMTEVGVVSQNENSKIQRKSLSEEITSITGQTTQRKCTQCEEEEELVQRKSINTQSAATTSAFNSQLNATKGRGDSMDSSTNQYMSSRFGVDFSHVNIHNNDKASKMSESINAKAFTLGNDIYFDKGAYRPDSNEGKRLLAHELTHVVQQRGSASAIQMQRRTSDPNVYETEHEGSQYRVRRIREPRESRGTRFPPTELDVDADQENVTIRISWCRGTRGEIRIGANVTGQALSIAQEIAGIIVSGGGREEVLTALRGADVTPFVETVIAKSGQWRIFVRGDITVGTGGVTAGGGRVGIRRGPLDIGIAGRGSEDGGSISAEIAITPGRSDETFDCRREVVTQTYTTRYICERHVPAHEETRTRDVERDDEQTRYIYFNYAEDVIDEARSQPILNDLDNLLTSGYVVTSVNGFTSPEGTEAPGRRFIGNKDLAQRRADAALARLQAVCVARASSLLSLGFCADNALTNVTPLGQGELYGRETEVENPRELRGRQLQEHTVEEFRSDDREDSHRNQEFLEDLEGLSLSQQTDRIYPLLRRAEVLLTKRITEQEDYLLEVPGGYQRRSCPEAVLSAARINFNLRDSL